LLKVGWPHRSLERDRRNNYGENDKASRKNIPRSKARSHREVRRTAKQQAGQLEKLAEDAVDRYVITAIESWTDNRAVQGFVRTLFNPSRSLSNVVQGRTPWFRARRSLGREPRPNPQSPIPNP